MPNEFCLFLFLSFISTSIPDSPRALESTVGPAEICHPTCDRASPGDDVRMTRTQLLYHRPGLYIFQATDLMCLLPSVLIIESRAELKLTPKISNDAFVFADLHCVLYSDEVYVIIFCGNIWETLYSPSSIVFYFCGMISYLWNNTPWIIDLFNCNRKYYYLIFKTYEKRKNWKFT